jgi:hypothetical protein
MENKIRYRKIMYRIGGWSALIAAILFRRNMDAEYYMLHSFGFFPNSIATMPSAITDWFLLLQNQPILGFILLNGLDIVNYILVGFIFFAIIKTFEGKHKIILRISAICTGLSIGMFILSNQVRPLFKISEVYIPGNTVQQQNHQAAGELLLFIHRLNHYSPSGIYPSYLLITIAGLLLAILMRKSDFFSKSCAWMGILANGIALTYWGFHFLLPNLEFIAPALSAIFLLIWYILIGLQLLKHAKSLATVDNQL